MKIAIARIPSNAGSRVVEWPTELELFVPDEEKILEHLVRKFYLRTSSSNDRNHAGKIQAHRCSYARGQRDAIRQISLFNKLRVKMISARRFLNRHSV